MRDQVDRRTVLRAGLAGVGAATAGCAGGGSGAPEFLPEVGGGSESQDVPPKIDAFLTAEPAAPNYDGSMYVADAVQHDIVNVYVGKESPSGTPVFDPPAIQVPPGSTVRWNWMGDTGRHALRSTAESAVTLDSGAPTNDRPDYQVSFPEEGIGLYECPVHDDVGMKGGIVVTAEPY
ncbi:MAG: hypothetical protein ABEJ57_06835 [Halobacteriaceae archaeon]